MVFKHEKLLYFWRKNSNKQENNYMQGMYHCVVTDFFLVLVLLCVTALSSTVCISLENILEGTHYRQKKIEKESATRGLETGRLYQAGGCVALYCCLMFPWQVKKYGISEYILSYCLNSDNVFITKRFLLNQARVLQQGITENHLDFREQGNNLKTYEISTPCLLCTVML